ncbi:DUF1127 domain-containing protein [Billgrantia antri]|uniref:DUF1127 domain-containing protein n=1 Tax=Billgrantia antri TaxID=2846777 RepID=A0ABS6ZRS6_9GAMM|nr:DUF1127 domain-containing protein [Halomonas antri]MBW6392550.1 DUF1127 domain-containing protein [Halomonas antri]
MIVKRLFHLFRLFREQQRRHRTRGELRHLDDRLLADIGLDRETVRREVRKPFWR